MARRMMALTLPFALGACCELLGGGDECSGGGPTWPTTPTPPATDITGRWQVPFAFCSVADLTMQRNAIRGTCRSTTTSTQTYNVEGYMEGESLSMGVVLAGNPTYQRENFWGQLAPADKNRVVGRVELIPRSGPPTSGTSGEMVRVQ